MHTILQNSTYLLNLYTTPGPRAPLFVSLKPSNSVYTLPEHSSFIFSFA